MNKSNWEWKAFGRQVKYNFAQHVISTGTVNVAVGT